MSEEFFSKKEIPDFKKISARCAFNKKILFFPGCGGDA